LDFESRFEIRAKAFAGIFERKTVEMKENPNFIIVGTRRWTRLKKNNFAQFTPFVRASQENY
jgi:hypothetical protein